MGTNVRYTYGESHGAAERLGLVAQIFEPTTTAFLRRIVTEPPALAVDLGCGPGHATRLIAEATGTAEVVGLDRSEAFLGMARAAAPSNTSFAIHDATQVPLPTGPADLLFSRLLLSHLADPERVVLGWVSQLLPGGLLLLDEAEVVDTDEPAFVDYLEQVARAVIAKQGAELYVGPALHAMADPPGCERIADDLAEFTPSASVTADIFARNLAVLSRGGEVGPRPDIAEPLQAIVEGGPARPATWRVRQIAFRRVHQASV